MSLVVDDVSGSGRIVVVAAGNEGADPMHAAVEVGVRSWRTSRFVVPAARTGLWVNAWYPGDRRMELKVVSPCGSTARVGPGSAPPPFDLPDGRVIVASGAVDARNEDRNVVVAVVPRPGESHVASGHWRLRIRAADGDPGLVELWMNDLTGDGGPAPSFVGVSLRDGTTIGSPAGGSQGDHRRLLHQQGDVAGRRRPERQRRLRARPDISLLQRRGAARRDEAPPFLDAKPTIAAPGAMLVSARSADAEYR